ncbi:hypothetical protein V8G54_009684, partial [Vigna mungo]
NTKPHLSLLFHLEFNFLTFFLYINPFNPNACPSLSHNLISKPRLSQPSFRDKIGMCSFSSKQPPYLSLLFVLNPPCSFKTHRHHCHIQKESTSARSKKKEKDDFEERNEDEKLEVVHGEQKHH